MIVGVAAGFTILFNIINHAFSFYNSSSIMNALTINLSQTNPNVPNTSLDSSNFSLSKILSLGKVKLVHL